MTNFEKYKDRIKELVDEGENFNCVLSRVRMGARGCPCADCKDCGKDSFEWLIEEYQEPNDNGWHDLREDPEDLPMENEEVLLEIDGFLFKYITGMLFDGVWKSIVNLDNQSRVIRWKEIEE